MNGEGNILSIRGFVLGVMLLAAVGWCMVQESVKQTQARYELAELNRREQAAKQRLERLRTEEQELRSPGRLAAIVREKQLKLVVLGSAKPVHTMQAVVPGTVARKPGEVLDDINSEIEEHMDMASAAQW